MGIPINQVPRENTVIDPQFSFGYGSGSNFVDALSKSSGIFPKTFDHSSKVLKASLLNTALGQMIAIGDNHGLYLLEFIDKCSLEGEIARLQLELKAHIIIGITDSISSVEDELKAYFNGKLKKFTTAIHLLGSPFQKSVWKKLCDIPYGQTWTYSEQAAAIERPEAYRAVANANGANQIAIVIPCHRVVNSNGSLGGYAGGVRRKQWLIEHEKTYV